MDTTTQNFPCASLGYGTVSHSPCITNQQRISYYWIQRYSQDNQFWATADTTYGKSWEPMICRGILYFISNFKIVPAHGPYNPIDTDKTIIFGKGTAIEDCLHGSSVPQTFLYGMYYLLLPRWDRLIIHTGDRSVLQSEL